jgi:hypothetical protein
MFDSRSRPHHGSFLADSKCGQQRRDGSPGAVEFRSLKPKERSLNSRGGGGLKSLAGRGQLPQCASRAEKIFAPNGLIFQRQIKRIQTGRRAHHGGRPKNCREIRGGGYGR